MRKIEREQIIKAIIRANPWWGGDSVGRFKNLPKRSHFDRLADLVLQKNPKRALVIMGPRRIGKTVLLYQLIDHLTKIGHSTKQLIYLSLDNPIFRLSTLEELITWGSEWTGSTLAGATIFFDEIQYLDTWEQQLKVLVDSFPETKFIVTGSAAAALHKKSKESGAGRFTNYLLPPLSFYEFISIKGEIEKTANESIDLLKLNSLYLEYLNYGGFPESIESEAFRNAPEQYIGQDILDKVLGRDLPSIFGISNPNELHRLFAALAYNTSNEVSPESISKEAGVPKNDINKYIEFLEAAFLVRIIEKTDHTLKKFQRRTHFKVVLTNPSLRSAIFGKLSSDDRDLEALAETAVFSQLIIHEIGFPSFKYARWNSGKNKGEVDLVHVTQKGEILAALEIKWSDNFANKNERPKSLIAFCKENELKTAFMTSKTIFSETQYDGLIIKHFPTSYLCFVLGFFGGMLDTVKHLTDSLIANNKVQLDPNEQNITSLQKTANTLQYFKPELMVHLKDAIEVITKLIIRTNSMKTKSTNQASPQK